VTPSPQGKALERRLGYSFKNPALLKQALTHPSSGIPDHNQRLEYLGDSLLNAALTLIIYREKPDWAEGHLSKLRHLLVSTDALHAWALDLGFTLQAGSGTPGTTFRKPLADAVEAILAAVFLDCQETGQDGMAVLIRLVEMRFLDTVRSAPIGIWEAHDPKTTLQERAASLGLPHPTYTLLEQKGADHAPRFRVRVLIGTLAAEAEERTRRGAEALAAAGLLEQLPKASPP
jgi:ribonuclease-3